MKKHPFVVVWSAILGLFLIYGASRDWTDKVAGVVFWGAVGLCAATCAVVGCYVFMRTKAGGLRRWQALAMMLGCGAASAVLPPLLVACTGLFHGEGGIMIFVAADLVFWIAFFTFVVSAILVACIPKQPGGRLRVPVWLLIGAVISVAAVAAVSPITVKRRIWSIDLRQVYPNIMQYYGREEPLVLRAGSYPANSGGDYYRYETTNCWVVLQPFLEDFPGHAENLRARQRGAPSTPIGEQCFYWDRGSGDGDWELVYQRLNLIVIFRFSGAKKPNMIRSREYKKCLEQSAKALDEAVLTGGSCVRFQDVRLGTVLRLNVKALPGVTFWIYSIFARR